MNIDDFKKQTKPGRWRSKLDPFTAEILSLHAEKYTLAQITEWIKVGHNVEVSRQAMGEFIRRRASQKVVARPAAAAEIPVSQESAPTLFEALDPEKREQRAKSFITHNTNPLFRKEQK